MPIFVSAQSRDSTPPAFSLLEAIEQSAGKIAGELPQGSRVAIVAFESDNENLSKFIMDELTGAFVEYGLEVADRRNLDFLAEEFDFQMSGMVNDESIVRVGNFLAANMVINGQFVRAGDIYRFRVNAIRLEQATHASTTRFNVRNDEATQRMVADISGQTGAQYTARTETAEAYRTSVENTPQTVGTFLDRGFLFNSRGDYRMAIADFTEALRLNPNNATAYFGRGWAYDQQDDYERAMADYNQALRLDPNNFLLYLYRGAAYLGQGDNSRAIADYSQAIRLNPNDVGGYFLRGLAYDIQGDIERAIADFSQAIRLNPNFANAYYNRGNMFGSKRDFDRAFADYSRAIQINPDYVDAYVKRGVVYAIKDDLDRAIADFEFALRIDPSNIEARQYLERARRQRRGW